MKNTKKIMVALLSLAMVSALAPMSVFAETKDTDVSLTKEATDDALYYVTIPQTLEVENSGWNALGTGIKVEKAPKEGSTTEYLPFTSSKKVTVTADSANSWKLTSTESTKTVGYTLKSASTDTAAVTTWDFTADEITQEGTTKTAGIDVNADDYDAAPAGTYTDKITFTISVEDAAYTPQTYSTLSSGDVLKPGDTVDSNTEYIFDDLSMALNPYFTWTLLRADVTAEGEDVDPIVTEKDDGAYYVIKGVDRDNGNTFYMVSSNSEGNLRGMIFSVTDTSDGVVLTQSGNYWTMAIHES